MPKDETEFASTNLASGVYDDETRVATITFQGGRVYEFDRIDPVMWDRLKSAPSAGRYLLANFGEGTEI